MKKILLVSTCFSFLVGCDPGPTAWFFACDPHKCDADTVFHDKLRAVYQKCDTQFSNHLTGGPQLAYEQCTMGGEEQAADDVGFQNNPCFDYSGFEEFEQTTYDIAGQYDNHQISWDSYVDQHRAANDKWNAEASNDCQNAN